MAAARLNAAVLAACALLSGCGTSPCGLTLQQHLFLPASVTINNQMQQRSVELPRCGGVAFQDVDLRNVDVEVDLSNPNLSGVDGFVTSAGCDRLFNAPYTGSAIAPLCTVYVGPVRPREVSARTNISPGRYRIFAQGYAANDAPLMRVSLDLGLWSSACKWTPIAP